MLNARYREPKVADQASIARRLKATKRPSVQPELKHRGKDLRRHAFKSESNEFGALGSLFSVTPVHPNPKPVREVLKRGEGRERARKDREHDPLNIERILNSPSSVTTEVDKQGNRRESASYDRVIMPSSARVA